jgi:membrane fusion protein, copper/silver efflux system
MLPSNGDRLNDPIDRSVPTEDEGGLRAPSELHGWRKAWWWFHFLILVKLARLRFIAILLVIGVVITQWDTLASYYDRWTKPASGTEAAASDVEFFCPMHPSVIRDNGKDKCPICFMPLSKRKKGSGEAVALPAGIVNRVQLSPYRMVLAGVQTSPVDYQSLTKEITAVGYVEFNERGQRTVSARVAGRIDKLVANETGQMVNAGDELALIYSPDLLVTVQNLLDAHRNSNKELMDGARRRLELLGVDAAQIDEILTSPKPDIHVKIYSPISGHVITKYVREGQYVQEGTPLYDVADLSTVWIQAQVYEDDLAFLPIDYQEHTGMMGSGGVDVTATTRAFPDEHFHGKLAFIYPHVDQDTRTVTVRFELDNPDHKLRPGSTATVTLKVEPKDLRMFTRLEDDKEPQEMLSQGRVLAVPESAVIDTGSQRIVYRESSPGVFEGIEVTIGPRMTGDDGAVLYPVLNGLSQGDMIVDSGSFLVDAETRLNPAAGSIYFGGSGGSQVTRSSVTNVRPTTPEDPEAKIVASLAKLQSDDRKLAEAQRFCPILTANRLGVMGVPVKISIKGQPVFLCCNGCKEKAFADPDGTLATVESLKAKAVSEAGPPETKASETTAEVNKDSDIQAALAELSPEDRRLAEAQRFCAVLNSNRLGSMGAPFKLMVEGQPVFLCCEGCKEKALANPKETLSNASQLKVRYAARDAAHDSLHRE